MEVPEDVYAVAARLRDVVYAYAWGGTQALKNH
jgi:hypothetical protein